MSYQEHGYLVKLTDKENRPHHVSAELVHLWEKCSELPEHWEWFARRAARQISGELNNRLPGTMYLPSFTVNKVVERRSNPHKVRRDRTTEMLKQTFRLFITQHVSPDQVVYFKDTPTMRGDSPEFCVRNESVLEVVDRGCYSFMNEVFNWIKWLQLPRRVESELWELILFDLIDMVEVLQRGTTQGKVKYFVDELPPPTLDCVLEHRAAAAVLAAEHEAEARARAQAVDHPDAVEMETRYERHHLQQVAAEENSIRKEIRAREARECRETMADIAALDKQ